MQSVLLVLDELKRIDDTRFVSCDTNLERVMRLDRLPRGGDRTRFIIRDARTEVVYQVDWRRSDGPIPFISLGVVESTGTPDDIERLLVKAGFRPIKTVKGDYVRPEQARRVLQIVRELRGQRVRVKVEHQGKALA